MAVAPKIHIFVNDYFPLIGLISSLTISGLGLGVGLTSAEDCAHSCQTEGKCISKEFSSKCYYIFNQRQQTWNESYALCESQNMTAAKLNTEALTSIFTLRDIAGSFASGTKVWLGGRAKDLNKWTFVNGVLLSETNANEPSPFQVGEETFQCGVVWSNLTVGKCDCRHMHHFVCRFDDWRGIAIYQITDITATWYDARSFCLNQGVDLFFLKQRDDIRFLKKKLSSYQDQKLFIGLAHRIWQWEDGKEIQHYNWQDMEPNRISEKCLAMYIREGLWVNMHCSATNYAFCEKDVVVPRSEITNLTQTCNVSKPPPLTWIPIRVILLSLGVFILVLLIRFICASMIRRKRYIGRHVNKQAAESVEMLDREVKKTSRKTKMMQNELLPRLDEESQKTPDEMLQKKVQDLIADVIKIQANSNEACTALENEIQNLKAKLGEIPLEIREIEDMMKKQELRTDKIEQTFTSKESLRREPLYTHWPHAVQFEENKQYAYVKLKLFDFVEVTCSLLDLNVFPDDRRVLLQVKMRNISGEEQIYEYRKDLPQNIVPIASKVKCERGYIVLEMKKVDENHSWQPYLLHLVSRL